MEKGGNNILMQLDELIELFEKLKVKATKEGIILENDPLYKNFELLAGNYKLIKNNIPVEFIEEVGLPIKDMIAQMVSQLKSEFGITENDVKAGSSLKDELLEVDQLLKNKNLSEEEINNLLDKRSNLNK